MAKQHEKQPDVSDVEAALGALRPAPSQIARDELFFRAGRQSVQRAAPPWVWLTIAAAVLVAAASRGVATALRPAPRETPVIVYLPLGPFGLPTGGLPHGPSPALPAAASVWTDPILAGPVGIGQPMFPTVAVSAARLTGMRSVAEAVRFASGSRPSVMYGTNGGTVPILIALPKETGERSQ